MAFIAFGKPLLVLFMVLVMGIPLTHYLKRDAKYAASKHLPQETRNKIWYGMQ